MNMTNEQDCTLENNIKQIIFSCGADVCGIVGNERFSTVPTGFSPTDIFKECKSVIVFGIALPKGLTKVEPRLVYGYYNAFSCTEVDRVALQGAKILEQKFHANAVPIPCDAPYEYWEQETLTGKGLISLKHFAVMSGIGTLGKNSILLNPVYGNLLTLGAILFDLELQSDILSESICIRGCRKCIEACPVQAIGQDKVNQLLCRKNTYGKTARGFDTVDCNMCRNVCPMRYGNINKTD